MTTRITGITFDCANALTVATFWSAVLDRPIDTSEPAPDAEFARLVPSEHGQGLTFVQVSEPKTVKNRTHLDLLTDDRKGEVERLLALGATHVHDQAWRDEEWTTLADPEGNEFCVVEH